MASVTLPLDDDDFLRRECPSCEQQFKWHYGPTGEEPEGVVDPTVYYCPLCGQPSGVDNWWTQEQIEYAQQVAMGLAVDELRDTFRDMERQSGGFIKFKSSGDDPEHPDALHEPEDMAIIAPPCHPWEPVKVPSDWTAPVHCLLCGAAYSLG
jgi:hypothetical protein